MVKTYTSTFKRLLAELVHIKYLAKDPKIELLNRKCGHSPISCKFRISQKTFYTRTIGNYIEMQTNLQLKPDNV